MKNKSHMHSYQNAPQANISRSSFNRPSTGKFTFDADDLVPFFVEEVLPGDTHKMKANLFGRLSTPINPIMDNMTLNTFFFFVPTRIIWSNWEKFMGAQDDPGDSTDFTIPILQSAQTFAEDSMGDYMGLPTKEALSNINQLPFRCCNKIYNDWFRDENLQDSLAEYTNDANQPQTEFPMQKRGKRFDYFTSCLTSPQKGVAVNLPLGTSAPINYDQAIGNEVGVYSTVEAAYKDLYSDGTAAAIDLGSGASTQAFSLYADLTNATASTINDIRTASAVQRMMETDARSGTRYTEKLKAHFGVTNPDFRLQRSEFLGGGNSPINITPIAQQSSTDGTSPQGNLAAMGTVSGHGHGFTQSFTEHGYIIGFVNVSADLTYQQGIDRMWSRSTIYDFFFPGLSQLGEMAVLNKEIFADGSASDELVFGYQEYASDYRHRNSKITSQFRSNATASLDPWHLSQDFSVLPVLNASFIESNTPLDRCVAVPAEPHFILDVYFKLTSVRPLPVQGIPGISKF